MANEEPVIMYGRIKVQTEKAILFIPDECEEGDWLPKSQVECDIAWESINEDDEIEIEIPMWLAIEKDYI
jgi:hypothetical protein